MSDVVTVVVVVAIVAVDFLVCWCGILALVLVLALVPGSWCHRVRAPSSGCQRQGQAAGELSVDRPVTRDVRGG